MTSFIITAGGMALVAILFVAIPLFRNRVSTSTIAHDAANVSIYHDQLAELEADRASGALAADQYEQTKHELERRLLQDVSTAAATPARKSARWPGIVALIAIPVLAAGIYWKLGNPAAIDIPTDPALAQLKQVEIMLPKLEKHLEDQPDDATGWQMLGKAYMALERYPEAVRAFDKLALLKPQDAQVLADYADALAMAQGQSLEGKPAQLLIAALRLDPHNAKALYLSGFASLAQGKPEEAAKHWNTLLTLLPPNSEDAAAVRDRLAEIKQPVTGGGQASTQASISGTVKLDPKLKGQLQPNDTLFVFARAAQGPRMPLAILRLQAKDLPANFTLDDSMAMSPQMKLSNFPEIVVGARVSKSGNAMPQPGDLEGTSQAVKVGAKQVRVVIDQQVQ
jgi:cytochrome c-type biogenesis protein CcmH